MLLNSKGSKHAKDFVERKLMIRLKVFFGVFALLLVIISYEVAREHITTTTSIGAIMIGMLLGAVFVRRKRIYWEEDTSRVIARMDRIGIMLLMLYIAFGIIRHLFLGHWISGQLVMGFSFSMAAGAMLGRLLSMRSQIRQILKEKKII
jgi:hypothetical protein